MNDVDSGVLLELAQTAAEEAGAFVLARLGSPVDVTTKSSNLDLVTEVDRQSEAMITQKLLEARPDDAVLGEEGTSHPGTSGVEWVIDPIDGTTSWVYGLPGFAVSIAARHGAEVVAGVVFAPAVGHLYTAERNGPSRLNGSPRRASAVTALGEALVATGFSPDHERRRRQGAAIGELLGDIRDIRRMGSAALDLAAVGVGQLDAYVEVGLNAWDVEAGALIAQSGGARVEMQVDPATGRLGVIAAAPGIADAFFAVVEARGIARI